MKIIVEPLPKNGVSISFDAPFSSVSPAGEETTTAAAVAARRTAVIEEILVFAFGARAAWIVTVAPQTWSLVNALPGGGAAATDEKIDGANYRFYFQTRCSREFLSEVAEDDEFARALLWFVVAPENDKTPVYEIVRRMNASARLKNVVPVVQNEWLFAGFDYAETVYWFNVPLPTGETLRKLEEIARAQNFAIDVSACS